MDYKIFDCHFVTKKRIKETLSLLHKKCSNIPVFRKSLEFDTKETVALIQTGLSTIL